MAFVDDVAVREYIGPGGAKLAYREVGEGRLLVLLHGFVSTGYVNWIKYGHAHLLADAGFRVVMPDLRGHGYSSRSHDPSQYPPDVLADDGFALLEHLGAGPGEFDLGGYSLGSRTTLRMLVRGARPGRAVLGGMGLSRMLDLSAASQWYRKVLANLDSYRHGDPEFMTQAFVRTVKGDPEALALVIGANVPLTLGDIEHVATDSLVLIGDKDDDHGSGADLARTLQNGRYLQIPGSHMAAVARPELGEAIAEFLGDPRGC